ncbi:carboxypeptidase regulatory-like domain-containing protein [Sphingomonas sp.]|uniref:carboxypeptidase regulatory-like domain-containing protein n=1 Tax=Sphingomonas sp. TaxID=28214 RepID=UPI001ED353D4|nr:carboxypeptidase regulatory-like domain-containing protein [Sphingomonas sp.]MBX3593265.1 carboxypeptidase regulatory-like domain-containing protein [Sphingomonas sp.]
MARPDLIVAVLIASGAAIGIARLLRIRRDTRALLLAALMLASAALLYLTLVPPRLPVAGETLVVATAQAPRTIPVASGERLVALPEAPAIVGAERVPDLATALRRYRQVARIRIVGRGLTARDRGDDAGVPVAFRPMPAPAGLTMLDPPGDTAAGGVFTLAGETQGVSGGSVELLDPAGRRIDQRRIGADGRFTMGGTARAPGLALFTLRLRDAGKAIVAETPVPLRTRARRPVRVLLVGAPAPETKYLRRWAEDSGIDLVSRLDAGGGVQLGSAPVGMDAASLRRFDAMIVDDRALDRLGGARSGITSAVAGGMGLIIRMTGPATAAARREWQGMGIAVAGGDETGPVALPALAGDAEALASRRGPGSADVAADINTIDDPAPELGRWTVRAGPDIVPAVRDDNGAMLAGWRQRGQGRVALWTVADSFALVLGGQAERYYQWWSDTLSAVVRPDPDFRPDLPALPRAGERIAICGLTGSPRVTTADGADVALAIDPAAGGRGCAAYWPAAAGVHVVVQPSKAGPRTFPFSVLNASAMATARMRETGDATARWAERQRAEGRTARQDRRGPAWPWFLAWLLVSAALWVGERRWRRTG